MATSPFDYAMTKLGKGEAPDRGDLMEYMKNGGVNLDPKTTAWCAAFVNSSLGHAGIKGTGSNLARSFLSYGEPTKSPQKGDIAVFTRGDPKGPYGHVGFFDSLNPDGTIRILAGNQGDAVAYGNMQPNSLLGYRRAPGTQPSAPQQPVMADGPKGQEAYPQAAPPLSAPRTIADAPIGTPQPTQAPQPQQSAPQGLLAMLTGGGETQGAANPLLSMLAAAQPQQAPQMLQPPQAPQQPSLADYITQFMQARTA